MNALKITPPTLDRIPTASLKIQGTEHVFIHPFYDSTGRIAWMKILNSGLAYGITHEGEFALLNLKGTDSADILEIHSIHETPEQMRLQFFTEQANRRMRNY